MSSDALGSAFCCLFGLAIAGAYFLWRFAVPAAETGWWERIDSPDGVQRRRWRRDLGMGILALVSTSQFLGINFIDWTRFPVEFALFWLIVAALLLWLCGLALADIHHTRTLHRDWVRQSARAVARDLGSLKEPAVVRRQGTVR